MTRSRLEHGYREKFRALLARVGPRRLEFGVELLMRRARALGAREGVAGGEALARLYEFTRWRVDRRVEVTGACHVRPRAWSAERPPLFLCDQSLGGLARWLRAAGHEAEALAGLRGDALVHEARRRNALLVTTDSRLLDRKDVRAGEVEVEWLPSGLDRARQLGMLLRGLGLPAREPRCMACGRELRAVAKDAVAARIPPRTARWRDHYWTCEGCGRLFWQGTHWRRIAARLEEERPSPVLPSWP